MHTLNMPYLIWELAQCQDLIYQILNELENISIALVEGKNPSFILNPPFNPFKTIGKY